MRNKRIALKLSLFSGALLALGASCAHRIEQKPADAQFHEVTGEFLTNYFAQRPLTAVALGLHQFDGEFVVPDKANLAAEKERLDYYAHTFEALQLEGISPAEKIDLRILQAAVANEQLAYNGKRIFWHNPMAYASLDYANSLDVSVYLKRDFKPLSERIRDITSILFQASAYLKAARENLDPILPKPFVETAIESARGTADFIEKDITHAAQTLPLGDKEIKSRFDSGAKIAIEAFRSYASWLETEKLPTADNSFPIGRDNYRAMLKTEMITMPPEEILALGMKKLREEQKRFMEAAAVVDPGKNPLDVFNSIQKEHPTAASLIPDARKNLEVIRQFNIDHHIITVPSEVRARVEETLPPFRAFFASMDTPGPFEMRANEAYYYITPVEPDWSPQKADEWLSAFNYYQLDVTSIHEAYPGHYVQFLALNASKASEVAKIFSSYPFVEGWAHYSEQMLLDEGFGQPTNPATASPAERIRAAKYRLAQSDEALLRLCRLCCSIQLHCQGMSVDSATRFFMDNCHYEEKPARAEAVRGTFDPGYLYYTLGKLMILKLRRDWQEQEGPNFTLQKFHDELLRHGTPPLPLLREIMLKDSKKWPEIL